MWHRVAVLLAALALLPLSAFAQTADNVLVVINSNSPPSIRVGEYYADARKIPERNIVRLKTVDTESVARADYESTVEAPISAWLARHRLQDQVLYIVLTTGVPLRINGTGGQTGTMASVDSELTLLYRKAVGAPTLLAGRIDNPYFLGDKPVSGAAHFSRQASDLYLVTRLDGFSIDDILKLIDRGVKPATDGQIVLDQKANVADRGGDFWMAETADRLRAMNQGARVMLETTRAIAAATGPVLGYFSWGSNDPANQRRQMGLTFANGAIGGMFVSTDGRTFREPPASWRPSPPSGTGGQSLAADLIREGITGVSAHVAEPYLDAIARPQVLFPAYLSGFNLAEAYYLSLPYLSWQNIVIGDPLCSPFGAAPQTSDQNAGRIDPETDLPALFAERRLAQLKPMNFNPAGLAVALKAMSLQAQERPQSEIEPLLVQATALEPRLTGPQLQLAQWAEARGDFDAAIERYRATTTADPNNVAALNNLAYSLADRKNAAAEALPLAERAYRMSGESPVIADTLGWVRYKLGDFTAALPLIEKAAHAEPKNLDILIHAASVHAALNNLPQARTYFDAAVKLDSKALDRADMKALQARIR